VPAAIALAVAVVAGLVDGRGLVTVLVLAGAAHFADHATNGAARVTAHVVTLSITAGLLLHAIPGFANPRVVDGAVLGPDALPYTEFLNFDKGLSGLILLGLYVPDRVQRDDGARHASAFLWRFVVLVVGMTALAVLSGYVRWDPKLPSWWPVWLWSMVVLTALPEEALFRGVVQSWIATWRLDDAGWSAIVTAGLVFGLAHLAGGWMYVLVASVAGVGYGWIYARTHSIGAAIAAHTGLNAVHFFLFSYPALAGAG
jgi:uncharacterized protein